MCPIRRSRAAVFFLLTWALLAMPRASAGPGLPAPARPVAEILRQPDLPQFGAPANPEALAAILHGAGWDCRFVSARELADQPRLQRAAPSLVVLPYGPVFPAEAREALLAHLQRGGNLVTTGGYAFNHLVRHVGAAWVSEVEHLARLRLEATRPDRSLLPDGRLETTTAIPIGGYSLDGQFRASGKRCHLTDEAHEGRHALVCELPPQGSDEGASGWADLPATPGRSYEVSAWVKTENVTGRGIGFVAMYEYDADGKLVTFRDFAAVRGTTDWKRYEYVFTPASGVRRLHLSLGLYDARGKVWVDDLRLNDVTGLQFHPMNKATGRPRDGLETEPLTLGMFDADYPLLRVSGGRTAAGQHVVPPGLAIAGTLTGWAASGTVGYGQARWVSLLEAHDRYGRSRGPLAALLIHDHGPFAGSCWAYFGVDNTDLFADPAGAGAKALAGFGRFLARHCHLSTLTTQHRLYRSGEPLRATAVVGRGGPEPVRYTVEFTLMPDGPTPPSSVGTTIRRDVTAEPAKPAEVPVEFAPLPEGSGLWVLTARLLEGSEVIDEMSTGLVRENPALRAQAPALRFRDNYFRLDGRPLFLFGSDDYAVTYQAACENPLTWSRMLSAANDIGLQLYENLQYANPGEQLGESDWRAFAAIDQLAQARGMVFMPGVLVGHNVAIGDDQLAREDRLCEEYSRRFAQSPALLWYLNGDYVLDASRSPSDVRGLWNRWLQSTHGSADRWRAAWGEASQSLTWGDLPYPPKNTGRWDDPVAVDRAGFEEWLMRRWNDGHVAAVRRHDPEHPVTSEYYSLPMGGVDPVRTIGSQDVCNVGFFDRPGADLASLPLRLALNDLRLRGKGVSLGEYGVKTHPAWSIKNGGEDYHIVRTPEEQRRLFMDVAHYAFGMGACKVQNWCLRDDPTWVFPWGLYHPNELIPRDVAYVHRNQSFVWRFFAPVFRPAPVVVCLASPLRRGNEENLGTTSAGRTIADLLALHQPFDTIDDEHLDALAPETRLLLAPSPLALSDASYGKLLAWIRRGGVAYVSGDLSRDERRRPATTPRLRKLAGLERMAEIYPPYDRSQGVPVDVDLAPLGLGRARLRPCLKVRCVDGDVLGRQVDGTPVLVRRQVSQGLVYFLSDPIEQSDIEADTTLRRQLVAAIAADAGRRLGASLAPIAIEPNDPQIHILRQPTARGAVYVIVNQRPAGGTTTVSLTPGAERIVMATADGWPALVHAASNGRILALSAAGEVRLAGRPLLSGPGLKALLALDRSDLRRSEAIVVAPFEPGTSRLTGRPGPWSAVVGEFQGGRWVTIERLPAAEGDPRLTIDPDRATCLILLCRPGQEDRWIAAMEEAQSHPERLPLE